MQVAEVARGFAFMGCVSFVFVDGSFKFFRFFCLGRVVIDLGCFLLLVCGEVVWWWGKLKTKASWQREREVQL